MPIIFANSFYHADDQTYSPEPMKEETREDEEEAGSFSPELLDGDENEEAIDPEEDRAILVCFNIRICSDLPASINLSNIFSLFCLLIN